ncbi:MAG: hypothetical protein NBV60_02070 [Erythrobacter sp.]|nr:hypothetical protein [Erythrobacter sp.]
MKAWAETFAGSCHQPLIAERLWHAFFARLYSSFTGAEVAAVQAYLSELAANDP